MSECKKCKALEEFNDELVVSKGGLRIKNKVLMELLERAKGDVETIKCYCHLLETKKCHRCLWLSDYKEIKDETTRNAAYKE